MSAAITYKCPECGSESVTGINVCRFNKKDQEWEITGEITDFRCENCENETDHIENWKVALDGPQKVAHEIKNRKE